MRFLTDEEAREWCGTQGLKTSSKRFLYYGGGSRCFSVGLEERPARVIALADYLVPTWADVPFRGALLWIRETGIWGEFSERTAAAIFRQMRLAAGEARALEERPGHLFSAGEIFEMHSYLVVPTLFGWDAFLVPQGEGYFLFVSHDGVVGVVTRTQEIYQQLYERVADWSPREDSEWYFRGTGIDLVPSNRPRTD